MSSSTTSTTTSTTTEVTAELLPSSRRSGSEQGGSSSRPIRAAARPLPSDAGGVGLGTSGSGDVLAGVVGGLLARGADPVHAAVLGAHLHKAAGDRLTERYGRVGFRARELLDELPGALSEL